MKIQIPTWEEIRDKVYDHSSLNPLEDFIYSEEPDEKERKKEFREKLQEMIKFMSEQW